MLYLDSSALAKRYLTEVGSAWVQTQADPTTGNVVFVAEITLVEVAAALAAAHRRSGGITLAERDAAVDLLHQHFDTEYQVIATTPAIIDHAVDLTQRYRLRGYDAVHLATALSVYDQLQSAGLPGLTLVSADDDQSTAAAMEGLATENPNHHP